MDNLTKILIYLLGLSVYGYVLFTLREKYLLMSNAIPDSLAKIDQDILDELSHRFEYKGVRMGIGDELVIMTTDKMIIEAVIVGADVDKQELVFKMGQMIHSFKGEDIIEFKILSRYGMFFRNSKKRA